MPGSIAPKTMPPLPASGWVDLHAHTLASDGRDTPRELVRKASQANLAAIAVTDHDTMSGVQEALEAGADYGVHVIPGCEISTATPYGEMHILGLWTPLASPAFAAWLVETRKIRHARNLAILERLQAAGIALAWADVAKHVKGDSPGRPHIAAALVDRGHAATTKEAFERYLAKGAVGYVPRTLPLPEEAVKRLAAAGAVSVLAHPMLLKAPLEWLKEKIGDLRANGLNGLEAYHSEHTQADVRTAVDMAAAHGLALSGGSDFHGVAHHGRDLGLGAGGMRLDARLLQTLHGLKTQD